VKFGWRWLGLLANMPYEAWFNNKVEGTALELAALDLDRHLVDPARWAQFRKR
jgi:hypothetical protein